MKVQETKSKNPNWKSSLQPKLIEFDSKFDYKKVEKMFFANVLSSISFLNRNKSSGKNKNTQSSKLQTRIDFNDSYDLDYQLSTSQLLNSTSLNSDSNAKSNYFSNSTGLNIKETDQESKYLLEETQIFDEMNEEQVSSSQERIFNKLESFYQEDGQQRHRISIDLTNNIIEDDNSTICDEDENTTTVVDNLSVNKGHANSLTDSFSRLSLKHDANQNQNNMNQKTNPEVSSSVPASSITVPSFNGGTNNLNSINRYYSPSVTLPKPSLSINQNQIKEISNQQQSNSNTDSINSNNTNQTVKPRTRFLRSKTVSELPHANIETTLNITTLMPSLDQDVSDPLKINYYKRFVANSLEQKNSIPLTSDSSIEKEISWNRNNLNNMKRIKTAIGIRNYPINNNNSMSPADLSTLTNSVFKQSISQKNQNLLTNNSISLSNTATTGSPVTNNPTATTHIQLHREVAIIDLQLPINRSFTVAGANLSQQQLLAISKRNNINKINDYYSITNSTDYAPTPEMPVVNSLSNGNHSANNTSLASKIILTTLAKPQTLSRTVSAQNIYYNELMRNSNTSSVENNENVANLFKKKTEFQTTFRNKKYFNYIQNQQKKRQFNSAKIRRPIIRHDMTMMNNEYLNNISSETLLIRRLKF